MQGECGVKQRDDLWHGPRQRYERADGAVDVAVRGRRARFAYERDCFSQSKFKGVDEGADGGVTG
jgi:hypothetical protein